MDSSSHRARGLERTFHDILSGSRTISNFNATQFLESVYSRSDPAACVDRIIASPNGLVALQQAMRSKLDSRFFNEHAEPLLTYFQAPDLKIIGGGQYLNNIVIKVVDPPIFWDAFRKAFLNRELNERAQFCVGWLLLQLCSLSMDLAGPYRQHKDTQTILDTLTSLSSSHSLRSIGQKLKNVLDTSMSLNSVDVVFGQGPGGRHDNDFEDFRKISILPTADEISSTETSFLRPADVLEDPETESSRVSIHLDNQFRLLREDMLYEMREELQIVFGLKKGFHRGIKIVNLFVEAVDCGAEGKRTKCTLILVCGSDIPDLKKESTKKGRRDFLNDHPKFLKHQSLACLVSGKEILAFPTILRDEDRLAKVPPEIVLQFDGEQSTQNALHKLKMKNDVTLIQIDTAIFAYEPILRRLKEVNSLPLATELLLWKKGTAVGHVPPQAEHLVKLLRANHQEDLQPLLLASKTIKLDKSQASSFICGLTQQISLIQGPPGLAFR